jgi:glutamine synthetase
LTPHEVFKYVKEHNIKIVDLKFNDMPGLWQHFSMPATDLSERPASLTIARSPSKAVRSFVATTSGGWDAPDSRS